MSLGTIANNALLYQTQYQYESYVFYYWSMFLSSARVFVAYVYAVIIANANFSPEKFAHRKDTPILYTIFIHWHLALKWKIVTNQLLEHQNLCLNFLKLIVSVEVITSAAFLYVYV